MKKSLSVLLTGFLFLISVSSVQAISLSFVPVSSTVLQGDTVSVDLVISDLGADSLSAFDLDVNFDSSLLTLDSVAFGDQLDLFGLGSFMADTSFVGGVNLFEVSFDTVADLNTLQADTFTLATLSFTASTLSVGTSSLGIAVNALGDASGNLLTADTGSGSIEVASASSPVPEPATMFLLGGGLFGMGFLKRRQGGVDKFVC